MNDLLDKVVSLASSGASQEIEALGFPIKDNKVNVPRTNSHGIIVGYHVVDVVPEYADGGALPNQADPISVGEAAQNLPESSSAAVTSINGQFTLPSDIIYKLEMYQVSGTLEDGVAVLDRLEELFIREIPDN